MKSLAQKYFFQALKQSFLPVTLFNYVSYNLLAIVDNDRKADLMRILVFGRLFITRKVITTLQEENIDVISIPDGFAEQIDLIEPKEITLAVLDCCANQMDRVYERINNNWHIPVVFIMNDRMENWKKVSRLDAVGFLPEVAGKKELRARLRGILRQIFVHRQA